MMATSDFDNKNTFCIGIYEFFRHHNDDNDCFHGKDRITRYERVAALLYILIENSISENKLNNTGIAKKLDFINVDDINSNKD